jgi:hypothetical protein
LLEERKDAKRLLLVIIATVAGSGVCGTGFAQGLSRTNAQGMVRHRVIAIANGSNAVFATPGEYGIGRERLAFASRAASVGGRQ